MLLASHPVSTSLPWPVLAGLEALERDVLHWVTCDLYTPWLHPLLMHAQEKVVAIPLLLVILGGLALRRPRRALRAFLTCLIGIGIVMLLADVMWATIDRKRPPHVYDELLLTRDAQAGCAARPDALVVRKSISHSPSFPSRHGLTIGVFATTLLLASPWLGAAAALYGIIAAVGRVYAGKHWPSDVIAGVLIGAVVAFLVWRLVPKLLDRLGRGSLVREADEVTDATG